MLLTLSRRDDAACRRRGATCGHVVRRAILMTGLALGLVSVPAPGSGRDAGGASEIASPASAGAMAPNLRAGADGRVYLSWVEPGATKRSVLRFSVLDGGRWSAPRDVASGDDWFVNWADFPSVVPLDGGALVAHWLVKNGEGTFAYSVHTSRSVDGGRTWQRPVVPHRDTTQTEHGFVSLVGWDGDRVATVWLDGRQIARHTGVYLPFERKVRLRADRPSTLVVRADYRGPYAQKRAGWHRTWFNFGGINREVTIRPVGASEIGDPEIQTRVRPDGTALVDLDVHVTNRTDRERRVPVVGVLRRGTDTYEVPFPTTTVPARTTTVVTLATLSTGFVLLPLTLGMLAGYRRGWVDSLIMRVGEILASLPGLPMLVLINATMRERFVGWVETVEGWLGTDALTKSGFADYFLIFFVLSLFGWVGGARLIRTQVLTLGDSEYVIAARASGASTMRILYKHILPNVMPLVVVGASAALGAIALTEIGLTFLGVGIQPPQPSFGVLITEGASRTVLESHPQLLLVPATIVASTIFAFNLLGDSINDVLTPRAR